MAQIPSLWRRNPFLMTLAHGMGLLFVIWFVMLGDKVTWALAGFVLLLTLSTQFWYFLIKYRTSHKELSVPFEMEFSERGMRVKTAKVNYFRAWQAYRKFCETKRCFLLYFGPWQYQILPKRHLSLEQQGALRTQLQARVTPA